MRRIGRCALPAWLAGAALIAGAASAATAAAPAGAGSSAGVAPGAARPAGGDRGPAAAPNDPLFVHQWNLRAIGIPRAWAVTRGAGATVALLDTGVAYRDRGPHRRAPDLAGTRFVAGWDFVDDDPHPDDVAPRDGRRSHGTQMAGLIAQTTGNGIGAAGVAPQAAIMPVRVLEPDLSGSARRLARGVRFAVERGADVISISIVGRSRSSVLDAALDHAAARGVLVVAAAGNDGAPRVGWPAAHPRALAVGAVARDLTRAPYSSYGPGLDLVAPAGAGERVDAGHGPGDGVVAQTLQGGPDSFCYCFTASTSAAAAQVSGVAALLVAAAPGAGAARLRAALLRGARDLGPRGRDDEYGAGLVQATGALAAIGSAPPPGRARRPPAAGADRRDGEAGPPWLVPAAAGGLAAAAGAALLAARRRRRRAD